MISHIFADSGLGIIVARFVEFRANEDFRQRGFCHSQAVAIHHRVLGAFVKIVARLAGRLGDNRGVVDGFTGLDVVGVGAEFGGKTQGCSCAGRKSGSSKGIKCRISKAYRMRNRNIDTGKLLVGTNSSYISRRSIKLHRIKHVLHNHIIGSGSAVVFHGQGDIDGIARARREFGNILVYRDMRLDDGDFEIFRHGGNQGAAIDRIRIFQSGDIDLAGGIDVFRGVFQHNIVLQLEGVGAGLIGGSGNHIAGIELDVVAVACISGELPGICQGGGCRWLAVESAVKTIAEKGR